MVAPLLPKAPRLTGPVASQGSSPDASRANLYFREEEVAFVGILVSKARLMVGMKTVRSESALSLWLEAESDKDSERQTHGKIAGTE